MSLLLHKEIYTVDSIDLYRVYSKVDGKDTLFLLQCLQTKVDAEIEIVIKNNLLLKGYTSEELTPINWE